MVDQFYIRAVEPCFVNRVHRELKPFLPLQSCSWLLREIFRKIETMSDRYDRRPLKTYGVILEDKEGNEYVDPSFVDTPFPKDRSLRLDFTRRVYYIYHQHADIIGMGDRLNVSKLMGYLDDIERQMKKVGFDLCEYISTIGIYLRKEEEYLNNLFPMDKDDFW